MSDVEGVTAEETTVPDSVENQPETEVKTETAEQAKEEVQQEQESVELTDEEIAELENDPKVKALLKKKTEGQKNALRHSQQAIEKRNAENAKQAAEIDRLSQRLSKIEEAKTEPPQEDDFETYEEYREARLKHEIKDEGLKGQEDEIKAELNKEIEARNTVAIERFQRQLQEISAEKPEVQHSVMAMRDELNAIRRYSPNDAGVTAIENFIAFEAENPVMLSHELMSDVAKKDALYGKPVHRQIEILKSYDQSLSAPPKPPETKPLPEPLSKTKGAAKPRKDITEGGVLKNLGLSKR